METEIINNLRDFFLASKELESLRIEIAEAEATGRGDVVNLLRITRKITNDRSEAARFLNTNIHKIEQLRTAV